MVDQTVVAQVYGCQYVVNTGSDNQDQDDGVVGVVMTMSSKVFVFASASHQHTVRVPKIKCPPLTVHKVRVQMEYG